MRIGTSLVLAALLLAPAAGSSSEIEGIRFAPRIEGDVPLELRATGLLRWRWVFKVYAAALYLEPQVAAERALEDVPKRLEIEYLVGIGAEDFARATRVKLAENLDPDAYARLEPQIEALSALYRDVGAGDRYALTYQPRSGVELALNGEPLGVVEGAEFAAALFAIWLGENPLDASLKRQLLSAR